MEPIDFANNCLEEVENWETLMFLYDAALRQVSTKIDILNEEFARIHKYNPIEHVKSRIEGTAKYREKVKTSGT